MIFCLNWKPIKTIRNRDGWELYSIKNELFAKITLFRDFRKYNKKYYQYSYYPNGIGSYQNPITGRSKYYDTLNNVQKFVLHQLNATIISPKLEPFT